MRMSETPLAELGRRPDQFLEFLACAPAAEAAARPCR
jgi:hypothetical protein